MSATTNCSVARMRMSTAPTERDLNRIPVARHGEYELSDAETAKTRRFIYSLNKDNAAGRRWRTMRERGLLLVWRIS